MGHQVRRRKISKITEELMRHMRNEEEPHVVESSAKKQGFREYQVNIIKYADMNGQVVIFCGTRGDDIALEFRNGIKKDSAQVTQENSMGIGLKSVVALMEDLGGSCRANEEGRIISFV